MGRELSFKYLQVTLTNTVAHNGKTDKSIEITLNRPIKLETNRNIFKLSAKIRN